MKVNNLPKQRIAFSQKGEAWRKENLDWARGRSNSEHEGIRSSFEKKKINYDLVNGIIHREDMERIVNPSDLKMDYKPESIQHIPTINSKIFILKGEDSRRKTPKNVVVTNPTSISEKENAKKSELAEKLTAIIQDTSISDEEAEGRINELNEYMTYDWKFIRETRANQLLTHYNKAKDFDLTFNDGLSDVFTVGEELYQLDIVQGEPTLEKLDPLQVKCFMGSSSKFVEDSDIILIEDFCSPGKIHDIYFDSLKKSDLEKLDNKTVTSSDHQSMEAGVVYGEAGKNGFLTEEQITGVALTGFSGKGASTDASGNIRRLRMYWKSKRKVFKVKKYDEVSGEEYFDFMPENYVLDKSRGEEATTHWINEAWEGTLIGEDIYVNIRPRPIQYNSIHNPSTCHFGIIGTIYKVNGASPYSLVDMMKPYAYFYDIVYARLHAEIANNWGKLLRIDFSKMPKDWTVDQWMFFAKKHKIIVEDSFSEGKYGSAQGKLAGSMNNASQGIVDADLGSSIQFYIELLQYIKQEMSEAIGITKQREGQTSSRETLGGIERATIQSANITEWYFMMHENTKKRVLECFIETAKIAMRGKNKQFQNILSDASHELVNIDGDLFAESSYGLVVDTTSDVDTVLSKIDNIAQFAIQSGKLSLATYTKLMNNTSIADMSRLIASDESRFDQAQQAANEQQMEIAQMTMEAEEARIDKEHASKERLAELDILGKIELERVKQDVQTEPSDTTLDWSKFHEDSRQFNAKLAETKRANNLKKK